MKTCRASSASNWLLDRQHLFFVSIFALCFLILCEGNQEVLLTEEGTAIYLELSELDMEDACAARSLDRAVQLAGIQTRINNRRPVDEDLDLYNILSWTADELAGHSSYEYGPELHRKLDLLLKRGDYAMEKSLWDNFTNFVEETEKLLIEETVPCEYNEEGQCTYDDINAILANTNNLTLAKEAFDYWNRNKTSQDWDKLFENLNLVIKASEKNDMSTVREYWESLCEIPGGYEKAQEIWLEIKPLYERLHEFIINRLVVHYGPEAGQNYTPSYLLGSLDGLDWSIKADILLPHPYIYRSITDILTKKDISGKSLYLFAENMVTPLGLGKASKTFWNDSLFNKTCPSKLIDFCQSGNTIVITCNNASWNNFLDAHETFMNVMQKKMSGDEMFHSSYLLRYGSRYSGTVEAVPLLGSILALKTHHLNSLININNEQDELVLLLLHALRTLPKIPYYLAVDTWRLQILDPEESGEEAQNYDTKEKIKMWKEVRQEYTLVDSYDDELYRDPYVLENKPYLAKFYGILSAFQIFAELIEEIPQDVPMEMHIAQDAKLSELMRSGLTQEWTDILMNLFYIYDIQPEALTSFYSSLDSYMTNFSLSEQEMSIPTTTTEIPTTIKTTDNIVMYSKNITTSYPRINIKSEDVNEVKEIDETNNSNLPWIFMSILGAVLSMIVIYIVKLKRKHNKRIKRKNKARAREIQANTRV